MAFTHDVYDIDPSREYDIPDPVYGPDPLGLEGITHSYAPWDKPGVSGDGPERYGLRPRDASGTQLPERSIFSKVGESIAETIPYFATFGVLDPEFSGRDLLGGAQGDLSSLGGQLPGLDVSLPFGFGGPWGWAAPTLRADKSGVSAHGGVVTAAKAIANPQQAYADAKQALARLQNLPEISVPKSDFGIGGSQQVVEAPLPRTDQLSLRGAEPASQPLEVSSLQPPAETNILGDAIETVAGIPGKIGDAVSGFFTEKPTQIASVEQPVVNREVNRQNQATSSKDRVGWAPENLNEGNEPLPLINKPSAVAPLPVAPVEPPPVQAPVTRTTFLGFGEDEGYDFLQAGLDPEGPRRFFQRQPVTAEGGGLMDLQRQADTLAAQGRGGDTMLVHMRPDEVAGLASLGTVTRNPVTGLPENFLGPALGALLGGSMMGSGAGWLTSALGTGAGAGLGQYAQSKYLGEDDPLRRGLVAGLTAGVGSAALGGFGQAFGDKAFADGGVNFDAGAGTSFGLGKGFKNLGNKARAALGENIGTTTGLLGSVGGIASESDAQQRLAQKGQEGIPIREASTYRGAESYSDPRLSPRTPTGLDQTDLRTYGFGPEQLFFDPRIRAQAGGGIHALLEWRNQNAADLQQGIDERDDPRYLEDTQDMTLTPPEGGDGLAASIVDQAIAAIKGDHPQAETAVNNFIEEFGEEAFVRLRSLIMQELAAEEMGEIKTSGLLEGSDGGRDDLRRGKIDGVEDVNVSSGEYLWSADDTSLAGGGNSKAGARRLDMARKKLREKAYGTAKRPNYIGEEEVEEVFDEVMTT
jgi:hypothetical protein